MDALPLDLLVHILSFLSVKDRFRLKQLNTHFREKIISLRNRFKLAEFGIILADCYSAQGKKKIWIKLHYYKRTFECELNCENPRFIVMESSKGKRFFDFLDNDGSLRAMFDSIFMNVDVSELCIAQLTNTDCILAIEESLRNTEARVKRVSTYPSNYSCQKMCKLLETVAKQKRIAANFPRLYIYQEHGKLAPNLRKMNECSSIFKSAVIKTEVHCTSGIIKEIVEGWGKNPFEKFFFDIYIDTRTVIANPPPFTIPGIEKNFKITRKNADRFEFSDFDHPEGSSIRLEDKETKNIIHFEKTNVARPANMFSSGEALNALIKIEISAILK